MKKGFRILVLTTFLVSMLFFADNLMAQPQPPDPMNTGIGGGNAGSGPIGGGAPVGSGLVFLLLMSAAYGAKKVFDSRKRIIE